MSINPSKSRSVRVWIIIGCLAAISLVAGTTKSHWLPLLQQARHEDSASAVGHEDHDHEGHEAHPAGHAEASSIELSENGLKNIGYESYTIEPSSYDRKLILPAIIVERPGRSQLHVTAPLTSVVTAIHAVTGEAIGPGEPLFDLRLTHEELVAAQRDYLRTAESLDVVNREIARLKSLDEGVIAGRRILEQEYEKQKLEASLRAEEQAMLLHSIGRPQINTILKTRQLIGTMTVYSPQHAHNGNSCRGDHLFQVQRLDVALGEQVEVGAELAVLGDHCELHIEGLAFVDDAPLIRRATETGQEVTARLLAGNSPGDRVTGLEVLYVADQIDPNSRAFKIYLRLSNEIVHEKSSSTGKQYIEWRFKPGQRMQVSVPIETWENQLVLPTTAVVDEGAEAYVYRQNGDHFDQVSVHILHRDQTTFVIANDGALFRGDIIAGNGAYQMHLALKNQSGGGIDPHAGHSH